MLEEFQKFLIAFKFEFTLTNTINILKTKNLSNIIDGINRSWFFKLERT